jgi:hypothetical protein
MAALFISELWYKLYEHIIKHFGKYHVYIPSSVQTPLETLLCLLRVDILPISKMNKQIQRC